VYLSNCVVLFSVVFASSSFLCWYRAVAIHVFDLNVIRNGIN
jgi:hypothetical protein